jgi:hypothetical protein
MAANKGIYQLKVTLKNSKPPIWRRILVPENVTLGTLHTIIQAAMGWDNYHQHEFTIFGKKYGEPDENDEMFKREIKNEAGINLNKIGLPTGTSFTYVYDFGDGWEHKILLEKIFPQDKNIHYPCCVAGKRACPPEDIGGPWMYENFLQAIKDPNHEQHDAYLEWIGDNFDAEEFDLNEINQVLGEIIITRSGKLDINMHDDDFLSISREQEEFAESTAAIIETLTPNELHEFDALPLRKNMLVFLDFLAQNRIIGTSSTGNLPLKAVYAICEKFVPPLELDHTIGDRVFKIHSEDQVWPLVFIHTLAIESNFLFGGQAQIWQVTPAAQQFIKFPAAVQVFIMFLYWYNGGSWETSYSLSGFSETLPPGFFKVSLNHLFNLSTEADSSYEKFADDVIAQNGLIWTSEDQNYVRSRLHYAIISMAIEPMVDFGVITCTYTEKVTYGFKTKELTGIRLTAIGAKLRDFIKGR